MIRFIACLSGWIFMLAQANSVFSQQNDIETVDLPPFVTAQLLHLFQAGQFRLALDDPDGKLVSYRLFQPTVVAAGEKCPMIVWLHGNGHDEIVHPNTGQLKHLEDLIFRDPNHPEKYNFFFLAAQSPSGTWYGQSTNESGDLLIALISELLHKYPIDPDRVVLTGVSSGGSACWEMAIRNPNLFAAIAPLASNGCALDKLNRIASVPVWAFHSTGDSPEQDRCTVSALQSMGGKCCLTEVRGVAHNCWHSAFVEHNLLQWLLAQRKGAVDSPGPGAESFIQLAKSFCNAYWPQIIVLLVVACGSVIFWRFWYI